MRRLPIIAIAVASLALPAVVVAAHAAPVATPSASNPGHCDPIGGWRPGDGVHNCLLPFPNDYFTTYDAHSRTHRRVALRTAGMPVNRLGLHINATAWDRSDGFSVGSQLLVDVPGMTSNADLAPSRLPRVDDIGRYRAKRAGVVVIDTRTGKRWPVWAELDQYTSEGGPALLPSGTRQQDLMIHPAVNFAPATRYVVGLRHLRLDNGRLAKPTAAFAAYRDGRAPASDPRTRHFRSIFRTLAKAGVHRHGLYLAWDFTTASVRNTTGRLLAMRNDAFRLLGDHNLADGKVQGHAPAFRITKVKRDPSPQLAKEVHGRITVPCYIEPSCAPVGDFGLTHGLYGVPRRSSKATFHPQFTCDVPKVAFGRHHQQLRPSLYGHGLFGDQSEVTAGNVEDMSQRHGMLECAVNWYGMSETDLPNALLDLTDLSNFPTLVDRVQQGVLDFLYMARLMIHPGGLCTSKVFHRANGHCIINRHRAYYDGNSQGGINGGTVCAVIPDATRCVLGVSGMDYSMLLPRSSDFVATDALLANPLKPLHGLSYSTILDTNYPDQSQRMVTLDLVQMLWDRSDPDGYAARMTTHPLPDTPRHHALLQIAWGDHQVTDVQAAAEARTIGARLVTPALLKARQRPWRQPFWGIRPMHGQRYDGSALVMFDSGPVRKVHGVTYGTNPPPRADVANRSGVDPHEGPRATVCGQRQKSAFLRPQGVVTLPCGGPPYFDMDWNGKAGLHRHG
ncbi:MAG TPA: hypothetical protein VG708_07060 [Mycobacteriales bacterium]|nr:hypothetical protein [Mycobacteriales bacterium]